MTRRAVNQLFLLLLASVAVYRLTLLDRGALALVDETWYFKSVMTVQALAVGHPREALGHVATNLARPGATLIRLPVAALQAVPLAFGVAASNPRSLLIPQVFNVAVSLVILYFFFEICLILCENATAALIAALVYALLVSTNLYVRHLLPYDWALMVAMWALWLGLRRPLTPRRAFAAGSLAAGAITIYPGYYILAPVLCVGIAGQAWRAGPWRAVRLAALFSAAGGLVILMMDLLCRLGGVSYIASLRAISRTIELGSMDEGWTFLPKYLIQVERVSGVVLIGATLAAAWRAASNIRSPRPVDWVLLPALAGAVWQAAYAAHFKQMVIYGRLIHPWMLFLAWALADTLARIERPTVRRVACGAIAIAALVSWVPSARAYYGLAYPSDVLYALRIDTERMEPNRARCELSRGIYFSPYASPSPLNRVTRYPYSRDSNFVLVNFCQAIGLLEAPAPPSTAAVAGTLLFDGPHWMTFPAYGFEGLPPDARQALINLPYRVRAYRSADRR